MEIAITTTTEEIIRQVDESLQRQLVKLPTELQRSESSNNKPEKIAEELSASCRSAVKVVLDATMHKALRDLIGSALSSVGAPKPTVLPSPLATSDNTLPGPSSAAGIAGLLAQHTKDAMESFKQKGGRTSSTDRATERRTSLGIILPKPENDDSFKDLFAPSHHKGNHSATDECRTSKSSGKHDHHHEQERKEATTKQSSAFLSALKKNAKSAKTVAKSGAKRAGRRMSTLGMGSSAPSHPNMASGQGTASMDEGGKERRGSASSPSATRPPAGARPGRSPAEGKSRCRNSMIDEDKMLLRAIQMGHSTEVALSRVKKAACQDDEVNGASSESPGSSAQSSRKNSMTGTGVRPTRSRQKSIDSAMPTEKGHGLRSRNSSVDLTALRNEPIVDERGANVGSVLGAAARSASCTITNKDLQKLNARVKRASVLARDDSGPIVLPQPDFSGSPKKTGSLAELLASGLSKEDDETGTELQSVDHLALEHPDEEEAIIPTSSGWKGFADRSQEKLRIALSVLPMVEPLSRMRIMWEMLLTLTSGMTLTVMPLAWAFPGWHEIATVVGYTSVPIYWFHILVKLRTAVPQHGMLNGNPLTVAYTYIFSSIFVTDLLTACAFLIQRTTSPHLTIVYLVTLRNILLATSTYERAFKASHNHRRVMVLVIFSLVLIHWTSCIWCMLADPDKKLRSALRGIPVDAPAEIMPESWFTLYTQQIHAPITPEPAAIYLYAVYWTLATTTTIGFGDVLPANELEVGVICVTICIGALLYSSLIAYMSNLILASDVNWTAHKQKVETITSYMRHRKIPALLQTRISEYLDYLWTTQKGLDESSITGFLPSTLQQQLSLFCNSRIISTVPLFANVPEHICAAIVMQLQPRTYVPDDLIITIGDWADEMFLIFRGVVKLVELSEQEGRSIYLKDGDYFGEIAVLTGGKRMMSVRAVTYCHLYSLQQRLLERILQQHPDCIDSLLLNMMNTYDNFDEIKERIFTLAGKDPDA